MLTHFTWLPWGPRGACNWVFCSSARRVCQTMHKIPRNMIVKNNEKQTDCQNNNTFIVTDYYFGTQTVRGWHALDFSVSWVFNRMEVDPPKSSPSVLGDGFFTSLISCSNLCDLARSLAVRKTHRPLDCSDSCTDMGVQADPIRFSLLNSPSNYFERRFDRQKIHILKQKLGQKKYLSWNAQISKESWFLQIA